MSPRIDPDADIRARFARMAQEDAAAAPALPDFDSLRVRRPARWRAPMRWAAGAAGVSALAAAATLIVLRQPPVPYPIDLSATAWTAPTDFLLNTPGSALLRHVPSIGVATAPPTEPTESTDTSNRSSK